MRAQARVQAQRAHISEASLLAAAEAASVNLAASGEFDPFALQHAISEMLAEQADQIAELQRRLEALTGDADPAAAALLMQARTALNEGRLTEADDLLAQSAARDLYAIEQADAEAERRRLRAGETIASRGQVALVQADYLVAAAHYGRAAETVPQRAIAIRWSYRHGQADAVYQRGDLFAEPDTLRESVRLFEDVVLPLAPRRRRPVDWARTQIDLGWARIRQGERGDTAALIAASESFAEAFDVFSAEGDHRSASVAQMGLGVVFQLQGQRGERGALERAVAAYELALALRTRDADPAGWATTQMNLGNAFAILGERGAEGMLDRAVGAFEAALTVRTRESDPAGWALAQNNLGIALTRQGQAGVPGALERAVLAFEAALTVSTLEANPNGWAMTQNNLGIALSDLGERGTPGALERAVVAYRAALSVWTRDINPLGWAGTTHNLAMAFRARGRMRDALEAAEGALAAYEEAGSAWGAAQSRALISQLRVK